MGGVRLLGLGLRGPDLGTRFRAEFDGDAARCVDELGDMVGGSLRSLGLANWPGGRLGWDFKQYGRLGDRDAVEALALTLLAGEGPDGLGWLGGALFRGGRLLGYLQAAEEDVEKALAILRRNMGREIQKLRDASDPVGAALFANLKAAGTGASELLTLDGLVLGRGQGQRSQDDAVLLHRATIEERSALSWFGEVVKRNEQREEGTRNSPMRGAKFEAPLVKHFARWAGSRPANPHCESVHLGELANGLRAGFPAPESLREVQAAMDAEGRELVEAVCAPEEIAEGPDAMDALFAGWEAALGDAPGLSEQRRAKLTLILQEVGRRFRETLGEPAGDWLAVVRAELGIKAQTFSDDWKLLRGLCPGGVVR